MAYIVMAYIVMAYIVMAYVVTAIGTLGQHDGARSSPCIGMGYIDGCAQMCTATRFECYAPPVKPLPRR